MTDIALAGAYLSSGSSSGIRCSKDDKSFTCQSKRAVNAVQVTIYFLFVTGMILYTYKNRKTLKKSLF